MCKDDKLSRAYKDILSQYLEKGYIRKVYDVKEDPTMWYLPHFPVIRNDKVTAEVLIVFDKAAKINGISLNDAIYQGPRLQKDLCAVLRRFRKYPGALVCDVAKMYLPIGLDPQYRKYHRFLWSSMNVLQFNSLVFGVNAAPFEAQFISQEHALKLKDYYPLAANTVQNSTYIDDFIDSVTEKNCGIKLYEELSAL